MLRFNVPEDEKPLLGSGVASAVVLMGIISWIGASLRGANFPLPAYAVILLLALASAATAFHLPDIDSDAYREGGAAPPFILLSHDTETGSVSLSDLMDESDAVVIGMFTPGSPNAERQMTDFQNAAKIISQDGHRVSFVQIATGEGLQAFNLDEYAIELNGSWPLLLDDSTVGRSLPSGATDAVIVIDSAGFIASWSPGSMPPSEINDATQKSSVGSGNSPLRLISMVAGTTILPLLILSLPSEGRYDDPKEAMIPAVGAFMTLGGSSLGFLVWATPVSFLSSAGMGAYWVFVEILISGILVYHGLAMLFRGRIGEVQALSDFLHSKLNQKYKDWRNAQRFSEDVYLGLWLAWLAWLVDPSLVAQGVGSMARSGVLGATLSPLMLLGFSLCAGLTILILRSLVLIFGKYSRLLGLLSVGVRPRAWGLSVAIMGSWTLISIIVGPLSSAM
tara:strand:- start:102 stop:1451 length:1350 start_codon:yes stop_codon:yes gene_type:complete